MSINTGKIVTPCSIVANGSIFDTFPSNISSRNALTLILTPCPTVTLPISISSTYALILTFDKSAILIRTVPPPTALVGEEMTWPTSTGLEMIVALRGDLTSVSSRAIFAFSTLTIDRICCDFADAKLSCISSKFLSAMLPSL